MPSHSFQKSNNTRQGGRMRVTYQDANGKQVQKWVTIPAPDHYAKHGLQQVEKYARRILTSKTPHAALTISTIDHQKSCLLTRRAGQLFILETIRLAPADRAKPEHEKAVRKLFQEFGIAPARDNVHEYNGVKDAMRDLEYPLKNDVGQVTKVLERLLQEVYHIRKKDGLDFTFEEYKEEANK